MKIFINPPRVNFNIDGDDAGFAVALAISCHTMPIELEDKKHKEASHFRTT